MINFEKTQVILIGIETYNDAYLHDLPAAFDDVAALSKVFTKTIGIPRKQIKRLIDVEERDDLMHKLKEVVKKNDVENLILYYAGHGVLDDDMINYYLTLSNSEIDDLEFTAVTIKKLSERLGSKSWNVILILDCCFSEKAFEQFSQRNFFVLASSARNKTSKYPLNNDHSAFTGKLIDVIQSGVNNGKEALSWDDIFEELKTRLVKDGFPEPKKASRNDVGNLPFVRNQHQGEETISVGKSDQEYLEQLFDALVVFDKSLVSKRHKIANSPSFLKEFKKLILRKFPYPIAYFLKNMLPEMEDVDANYLFHFYENLVRFLGLSLIAAATQQETKSEELVALLQQIDRPNHAFYLKIMPLIKDAFGENLFIKEFAPRFDQIWKDLLEMEALHQDNCEDLEIIKKELIDLVAQLSFLSNYQFISIRFIDVQTGYDEHTQFRHQGSVLHGEILKPYQNDLSFNQNFLKSNSILIFKATNVSAINAATEYLNLWPLIIDVNSFESKNNVPELHFLTGRKNQEYIYQALSFENQPAKAYQHYHKSLEPEVLKRFFNLFESQLTG